jgi:hypothetical protein
MSSAYTGILLTNWFFAFMERETTSFAKMCAMAALSIIIMHLLLFATVFIIESFCAVFEKGPKNG